SALRRPRPRAQLPLAVLPTRRAGPGALPPRTTPPRIRRAGQGALPPWTTLTRIPSRALVLGHENFVLRFGSAQKIWVHGGSAPCPTRLPPDRSPPIAVGCGCCVALNSTQREGGAGGHPR